MGSIAEQKYNLIRLLFAVDNPLLLDWLERELYKWQQELPGMAPLIDTREYETLKAKLLLKPLRETFDAEAVKQESGWKGQHDKVEMIRLIKEMDIQEPVELLLSQLSK